MDGRRDTKRPEWLRVKLGVGERSGEVRSLLRDLRLATVCQEAMCPNVSECFSSGTATFLLMGRVCTRNCRFCDIEPGVPLPLDPSEPERVAEAVRRLGLRFVVLTCVTRDDVPDGGASHVAETVRTVRVVNTGVKVEVLSSDLGGSLSALRTLLDSAPDVFNHNVETVPRLYPILRPQAEYKRSLVVLDTARQMEPGLSTKSGLMVGAGEEMEEVCAVMRDLRDASVGLVTIGQYLAPSREHAPVVRYVHPDEFSELAEYGRSLGFAHVESGPLVRSSYHAAFQVSDG